MAHRTDSNEFDILSALRTMNVSMNALAMYASQSEDVEFAQRLPNSAAATNEHRRELLKQIDVVTPHKWEGQRPKYVPAYLPPYPKQHTYCHTPAKIEPVPVSAKLRRFAKQQRSVEETLVAIYARSSKKTPPHTEYATAMSVVPRKKKAAAKQSVAPSGVSLTSREAAPEALRQEIEASMKKMDTRRDVSDTEDDEEPVVAAYAPVPTTAAMATASSPALVTAAVTPPGGMTPMAQSLSSSFGAAPTATATMPQGPQPGGTFSSA